MSGWIHVTAGKYYFVDRDSTMLLQEGESFFESKGILHYGKNNIILAVDQELADYYRSLVPPCIDYNLPLYPAHISVVRKEIPPHLEAWGRHEGEEISFWYSNIIHFGQVYFWLIAFCSRLEDIRRELGLPVASMYTLPPELPEGCVRCYHTTLGNFKGIC
jgi:hypothetical protein